MAGTDSDRIVIRRGKRHIEKPHLGSWKIAYADFMTAMMAFFLVMWLVSITSAADREGLAEYFQTPLKVAISGGANSSSSSSPIPLHGGDLTPSPGEVRRSMPSRLSQQPTSGAERRDAERLENLQDTLESLIERNPVLREYRPQLLIDMTSEGLRIQIVDDQERPMFRTGSSTVEPYMRAILREIGPVLNDLPNKVSLAGHTDSRQYALGDRAYSNWELSADRANASRRELIAGGMDSAKVMRVMGLASSMHLVKDDPYADVNRRISLVVLNLATQRRIELENASAAEIEQQSMAGAMDELQTLAEPSSVGQGPQGDAERTGTPTDGPSQSGGELTGDPAGMPSGEAVLPEE